MLHAAGNQKYTFKFYARKNFQFLGGLSNIIKGNFAHIPPPSRVKLWSFFFFFNLKLNDLLHKHLFTATEHDNNK